MKLPKKNPDFIFCSDLHLREDNPECRKDNFLETLIGKLRFIKEVQEKYDNCPVLIPGDIFHHWKPSPYLISLVIENMPDNVIAIPGQHDLPQHNIDLLNKAGLYVLEKAGKAKILSEGETISIANIEITGFPFGSELIGTEKEEGFIKIALCHTLTWSQKLPYPDCELDNASALLKKMKNFDLVLVGDNHLQFSAEIKNRKLISPGSISRQAADQIDFEPAIYLYYAESNSIIPIPIPIDTEVVTREHLEKKEQRDQRIDAFVSRLNSNWEGSINFEENLERLMRKNKIKEEIKKIVYKSLET